MDSKINTVCRGRIWATRFIVGIQQPYIKRHRAVVNMIMEFLDQLNDYWLPKKGAALFPGSWRNPSHQSAKNIITNKKYVLRKLSPVPVSHNLNFIL
jgi:hypothetical protein